MVHLLRDFGNLWQVPDLKKVSHHSTLCRAEKRLRKRALDSLLDALFRRARVPRLLRKALQGAVDGTSLETRHVSPQFIHWTKRLLALAFLTQIDGHLRRTYPSDCRLSGSSDVPVTFGICPGSWLKPIGTCGLARSAA